MRVDSIETLVFLPLLIFGSVAAAQSPGSPQPLNAAVSDYGTTYIFSPPVICSRCVETELGFVADPQSPNDARYLATVLTVAPFKTHTDVSVLANLLDSEVAAGRRATQVGNRLDFVLRQQVLQKADLILTLAPRGAAFIRGVQGGRTGATVAPQWSHGHSLIAANITWTGAVGFSNVNPRNDEVAAFDFFQTLRPRGTAIFAGLQQEDVGSQQMIGTEAGLILPFRNGQIELASQQLNLNTSFQWQFQARIIVNWGSSFLHR